MTKQELEVKVKELEAQVNILMRVIEKQPDSPCWPWGIDYTKPYVTYTAHETGKSVASETYTSINNPNVRVNASSDFLNADTVGL